MDRQTALCQMRSILVMFASELKTSGAFRSQAAVHSHTVSLENETWKTNKQKPLEVFGIALRSAECPLVLFSIPFLNWTDVVYLKHPH